MDKLLQKAQSKKKDERSAASNHQGHQKTPSFIFALVQDALLKLHLRENDSEEPDGNLVNLHQPRGGFTDVGLHTGGKARNTAWPLFKEALKAVLQYSSVYQSPSPELFECALARFYGWLLDRQVALLTPQNATQLMLNAAMKMLEVSSNSAAELIDQGFALGQAVEDSCQKARVQLEAVAMQRAELAAKELQFPPEFADDALSEGYVLPKGTVPPLFPAPVQDGDMDAARKRALENLAPLLLPSVEDSFSNILSRLKMNYKNSEGPQGLIAQHCMQVVEQSLFKRAAENFKALPDDEVAALEKLVDFYREVLQQFMGSASSKSRMQSELHSRAVLVAWLAYCLIHATAVAKYPLLRTRYGVGLVHTDLGHLVLSDRDSCDALLAVCKYLKNRTTSSPVFTLRNPEPTLVFAEAFANSSSSMAAVLKTEQIIAEQRRNSHWAKVQEMKKLLKAYRADLVEAKAKVSTLDSERSLAQSERDCERYRSSYYYEKDRYLDGVISELNSARQRVQSIESSIATYNQPLSPLIHPLPKNATHARKWIFFLYMPDVLRKLSRMTFLAQQLLIPTGFDVDGLSFETDLVDHYNRHQSSTYNSATKKSTSLKLEGFQGAVKFVSSQVVPEEKSLRPSSIDNYRDESSGVWHPDTLSPGMVWKGSDCSADAVSSSYFNPFSKYNHTDMVDFFTEKLTGEAKHLQWAMPQYGAQVARNRSNLAIANQNGKPNWLNKPGYFDFGSLRAYPFQQLRKLCVALRERTLPLGNHAVQALIRQALYHVGDISQENTPAFIWREEWEENSCSQLLQTLCKEVSSLADELQQMPRNYDSVALLGELAAFFSDWHAPFLPIARRFAAIAEKFADDEESQVVDVDPEKSRHVRTKQCLLRMNAQICHYSGDLNATDISRMLKLVILINYSKVFMEDDPLKQQISLMHVRCHQTMVKRINEIMEAISKSPEILTAAVRLILQRAPADLAWRVLQGASNSCKVAAFEAIGSDGHLYSVNILDGSVLLDGRPHQRLPKSIMGHSLYQRTFGNWNFEVAGHGVYKTSSPVKGRFYEFYVDTNDELVVIELDEREYKLQLLDIGADGRCGSWGAQLPTRLQELYSHWICRLVGFKLNYSLFDVEYKFSESISFSLLSFFARESGVLVLRPKKFTNHKSFFILRWDNSHAASTQEVDFTCYRVPSHLGSVHWETLLGSERSAQLTDQLVLHSSNITKVLSKFEDTSYIHCYVNSTFVDAEVLESPLSKRKMLFELPRYHLEFELSPEGLLSLDYLGYQLASKQQLLSPMLAGYTLPDFHQYLILEKSTSTATAVTSHRPSSVVLVPTGRVLPNKQTANPELPSVFISTPSRSSASLAVHKYEVHESYSYLVARSIFSRLQLAALYAATGSLLPEPGSNATGSQIAMDLVRQCWSNRPLGMLEVQQLEDINNLGRFAAPGLPLLTYDLHASSIQLLTLHYPYEEVWLAREESKVAPALNPDDATAYLLYSSRSRQLGGGNPRLLLTLGEEKRVLEAQKPPLETPSWMRMGQYKAIEVPACPVESYIVSNLEQKLCALVQKAPAQDGALATLEVPKYPLGTAGSTPLEKDMHNELGASWEAYHTEAGTAEVIVAGALARVTAIANKVNVHYKTAQRYLEQHLFAVAEDVGCHGTSFTLKRLAGTIPCAGIRDLIRLAIEPEVAKNFNHFVTQTSITHLSHGARVWLQLGVLQNRLKRILYLMELLVENPNEAPGFQELLIMVLETLQFLPFFLL